MTRCASTLIDDFYLNHQGIPQHKAPVYGANFIVYDDKGREIYKKHHRLGPDLSYNFSMTTPIASTSGGFRAVISTSLKSRPPHGVDISISAMNSIR